jgi:ArsR family transcriptional regulator, cadmium/lead-responsive transcriptional repressor
MGISAASGQVERIELAPAAALFRSLGDPNRLAIVRRLAVGPTRVTDLVEALGLAQSTVSKHLACLRECGNSHVFADYSHVFVDRTVTPRTLDTSDVRI